MRKLTPRNEDKFGIIIDDTHKFNSIEEAENYVKDLKDKLKRRASAEEFPINTAFPEERKRYIEYAISLMIPKNLPCVDHKRIERGRSVLWLIANGFTYHAIVRFLQKNGFGNATVEKVKEVEKEAMRMCKDAITHVKNTGIPVLGG